VTDGAKLWPFGGSFVFRTFPGLALIVLAASGCARGPAPRVFGVYAHDSRALVRLDYDHDGDGRIEARTYMRRGRPVRLEADANANGFIERWEYYDATGALLRIGGSTHDDGREDMWVRAEGARRFVDVASAHDRWIDRREVYEADTLVRAESDSNRDGLADRWEEFRDGALVRLMLDDERRHGRPTRRIVYGPAPIARVEIDFDGDGEWTAVDAR
jgi:hypothetical protein